MNKILAAAAILLAFGSVADAQTVTMLTQCQAITQPGLYDFRITTPAGHIGPCLDVQSHDVALVAPLNSWIIGNGSDTGIRVEPSAYNFQMTCADAGCLLKNMAYGIVQKRSPDQPGESFGALYNFNFNQQLFIQGTTGCRAGMWLENMHNVEVRFGDFSSLNGDGMTARCPGGEPLHVGQQAGATASVQFSGAIVGQ